MGKKSSREKRKVIDYLVQKFMMQTLPIDDWSEVLHIGLCFRFRYKIFIFMESISDRKTENKSD